MSDTITPGVLYDATYLKEILVSNLPPSDGQVLGYSSSLKIWHPIDQTGGGISLPFTVPYSSNIALNALSCVLLGVDPSGNLLVGDGNESVTITNLQTNVVSNIYGTEVIDLGSAGGSGTVISFDGGGNTYFESDISTPAGNFGSLFDGSGGNVAYAGYADEASYAIYDAWGDTLTSLFDGSGGHVAYAWSANYAETANSASYAGTNGGLYYYNSDTLTDATGNIYTFGGQMLCDANGLLYPPQAATSSAPGYVLGAMYFDTTLNKLCVGGASGWETVTSV